MGNNHFFNKLKIVFSILVLLQLSCKSPPEKKQAVTTNDFRFMELGIAELQEGYKDGSYTIKELVEAYLKRIAEIDKNGPMLKSIIQVNPDAIQIAEQLDLEMAAGKLRGPLHGIPI